MAGGVVRSQQVWTQMHPGVPFRAQGKQFGSRCVVGSVMPVTWRLTGCMGQMAVFWDGSLSCDCLAVTGLAAHWWPNTF
jgi:hypothetical protein